MTFFDVLLEVFLHREQLVAGGTLVADVLKQLLVGVHPLEVASESRLKKTKKGGVSQAPLANQAYILGQQQYFECASSH